MPCSLHRRRGPGVVPGCRVMGIRKRRPRGPARSRSGTDEADEADVPLRSPSSPTYQTYGPPFADGRQRNLGFLLKEPSRDPDRSCGPARSEPPVDKGARREKINCAIRVELASPIGVRPPTRADTDASSTRTSYSRDTRSATPHEHSYRDLVPLIERHSRGSETGHPKPSRLTHSPRN